MIMATVGQVITQAQAEFESKRVRKAPEETAPAEAAAPVEVQPPVVAPVEAVPQATA
jgi:hypothetical protein